MELIIRARGCEVDDDTREMIVRRTRFALDAFGHVVESIAIYLLDMYGRRGGVDKLCQANIRLTGMSQLAVIEQAATLAGAVNRVLRTARHRIAEEVRRARVPQPESIRTAVA
jgi:hypothetical protein